MEFILPSPKRYCFAGFLGREYWVYFANAHDDVFEKINVRTGKVIQLRALSISVADHYMLNC